MKSNFSIEDFELTGEERDAIRQMDGRNRVSRYLGTFREYGCVSLLNASAERAFRRRAEYRMPVCAAIFADGILTSAIPSRIYFVNYIIQKNMRLTPGNQIQRTGLNC